MWLADREYQVLLHKQLKGGMFVRLYPSVKNQSKLSSSDCEYWPILGGLQAAAQNVGHSIMISCNIKTVHACVIEGKLFVIMFCDGSPQQTGRAHAS